MTPSDTAVILIGYQKDYFSSTGILRQVVEECLEATGALKNTELLLERLAPTDVTLISTPIFFTENYEELANPSGILKIIKEVGAFKQTAEGSDTIDELSCYGDRIQEIPGKRGLNAFSNTQLASTLQAKGITRVALAGVVTSICIDSTGRAAYEQGLDVTVLSDCTSGRSVTEQDFYCENIFPIYANVSSLSEFLGSLGA